MARVLVTGGSGFVGSHLCRALVARGDEVVAVDNLLTGRRDNVADLLAGPGFELVVADVRDGLAMAGRFDAVMHLASAASPPAFLAHPIETLETGSIGTQAALDLARRDGARFLLASTSEVYGDPLEHPQTEAYWGNVNPVGPRSVYDEAKRYAEAITMAYHRTHGVDTKIVRIFNTYGPSMAPGDGRVVTNFLEQALNGRPLTVYGDGSQTRSFCWVSDLVRGLILLLDSAWVGPMNLGNPDEFTVLDLARIVLEATGSSSRLEFHELPVDDPVRRRPDITVAGRELGWVPEVSLFEGVRRLAEHLRSAA
jgi:dTDP-glucose 4,6-dehydratase